MRLSVHDTFVTKTIDVDHADLDACFCGVDAEVRRYLTDRLRTTPVKFYLELAVRMERLTDDGIANIGVRRGSLPSVLLHESQLSEVLEQAQSEINDVLDKFTQLGSNWMLSKVEKYRCVRPRIIRLAEATSSLHLKRLQKPRPC